MIIIDRVGRFLTLSPRSFAACSFSVADLPVCAKAWQAEADSKIQTMQDNTILCNFAGMSDLIVKNGNGNQLKNGDSVTLIKSLKVKGGGTTLKQGELVKKIRLSDNGDEFDCK